MLLTRQIEYQESYSGESSIDDGNNDEDAEISSEESCERDSHFGDIALDALANKQRSPGVCSAFRGNLSQRYLLEASIGLTSRVLQWP